MLQQVMIAFTTQMNLPHVLTELDDRPVICGVLDSSYRNLVGDTTASVLVLTTTEAAVVCNNNPKMMI